MCPTLTVGSFFRHEMSTFLFSSFVQQLGGGSKRGGSKHSKSQNLVQNKKKETNGCPGKHNKGPKLDISNFFWHYETFFRIFLLQQAPSSIFYIPSTSNFSMSQKGSPFHTLEQTGVSKSPKGPPFYNSKNFALFEF